MPRKPANTNNVVRGGSRAGARGSLLLASIRVRASAKRQQQLPPPRRRSKGPVAFREAVDLAFQHSGIMGIAAVNQWRSIKAYQEARNHYLPQLTVGSGLGYSYGFPLTLEGSAPSVVNFTSSQCNLSLQQFIKAAKIQWKAESFDVEDKRAGHSRCRAQLRATE